MHYRDVLKTCAGILNDRNQKYGDSDVCFGRISKIASVVLDKPVSEYDVAIILSCVKLGRIPGNPAYADNYVDLANYAAFSAHFADKTSATENVIKPSFSRSPADDHVTIKTPVMRGGEAGLFRLGLEARAGEQRQKRRRGGRRPASTVSNS